MNDGAQFPDAVIDRLHILWGEGFLSPGGPQAVREIVAGLDLRGKRVLDIGCGTAGPAIVLARELGSREVVGIDVEPRLLEHAARQVERESLATAIVLKLVKPGPLPFADGSFDVVFSKDSIFQINDKAGLFGEIARVLRRGGAFAASDWLAHRNAHRMPEFVRYLALRKLDFAMLTASRMKVLMRRAGLENVSAQDRNKRFAEVLAYDVNQIEGPLESRLIAAMGEQDYARWAILRRACADAARCGGLRPARLRGRLPTHVRGMRVAPIDNAF